MSESTCGTTASAILKNEHQVILRVVQVLGQLRQKSERGEGFDTESLRQCVEFFRFFADACHHAKEEDLLFPKLEERGLPREGGPIGMMLYEHGLAREFTQQMGVALDRFEAGESNAEVDFRLSAEQYGELLTNHIAKEDNILFNMGDNVMTPEDQSTLCDKFCEVGCRSFGGKNREQLEAMADELESRCTS